jgi:murein DD-endopeptidase MepM/ murein hydrolase activator NlpD
MKADDLRKALFFARPRGSLLAAGVATLFGASVLVAASYMLFHDDILRGLLDRQIEMQSAYEDQLAAARLQLDQSATRQALDRDGVKGEIEKLVLRATTLELRAAAVDALAERVSHESAREIASAQIKLTPDPPAKPEPEEWDLRLGDTAAAARAESASTKAADADLAPEAQLASLTLSFDRVEREQTLRLAAIARPASAAASQLKRVLDMAGLSADRILARRRRPEATPAVGGPLMPADEPASGTTAFERNLADARSAVGTLDRLRGALPSLPLRKPLNGASRLSSGFGYRVDPFLGKPALHSGVDLLDDYGEPVRAAAGGMVVAAGPSGGYGNMIEVDHGSGFSTRYGHLSQISVAPGQKIPPGAVLGRVGSTGRATAAHLHYEVRSEGEAIDPTRFLRAAAALKEMGE